MILKDFISSLNSSRKNLIFNYTMFATHTKTSLSKPFIVKTLTH